MPPIIPADLPLGRLPFSPGWQANGLVFVSGQASTDHLGHIVPDSFEGEFRRALENMRKVLAAAGLDFADVVQVRGYLANADDLPAYNRLYTDYFAAPYPSRTTIVNCLVGIKFEIEAIAVERAAHA